MAKVLVIGAAGTVGRALVSQLLADNVDVRALLRDPDAAELPAAIERVRGDLTVPETIELATRNIDAVFLIWTAPPATAPAVIDRIARHVPRLVFLTAPHQTPHPLFQQPNPLAAVLSTIERHIEASRLPWTFIRPGMFAANCIDWWAPAFRNHETIRWPLLQAPTAPIDPRDIAAVAATVLTGPDHAAKNYVITGPESLTQLEQLQIIADTIQRPLHYEDLTADEARRTFPPGFGMLIDAWVAAIGQPAYITSTVDELLGRPAYSFRAWAHHNASAFAPHNPQD